MVEIEKKRARRKEKKRHGKKDAKDERERGRERNRERKGEKETARDGERRKEVRRGKINRRSCTRWPINCAAQPRGYQDCYVSHSCEKLDRWRYLKARQIRVANGHVCEHIRPPTQLWDYRKNNRYCVHPFPEPSVNNASLPLPSSGLSYIWKNIRLLFH